MDMYHQHKSQTDEWLPFNMRVPDQVPASDADRRAWLGNTRKGESYATLYRDKLIELYNPMNGLKRVIIIPIVPSSNKKHHSERSNQYEKVFGFYRQIYSNPYCDLFYSRCTRLPASDKTVLCWLESCLLIFHGNTKRHRIVG